MDKFELKHSISFFYFFYFGLVLCPLVAAAELLPFDYYRLALQWPPSVSKLNGTAPERFTIHGLWPDNKSGANVEFCNPSDRFNTITDTTLLANMNNNWPSLESNNNVGFWSHQWRKHGTCSRLSQREYWNLGLNLHGQYNILQQLKNNNIVPKPANDTSKYAVNDIKKSVKSLTSGDPDILCYSGKLAEVRICIEPIVTYRVIDCPAHHSAMCSGKTKFPKSS